MTKKWKIGITCYPSVGGSGVVATELGKLLARRGHEIHFITSSEPFRLTGYDPNIYFHEVQVNQYSVFRYPPYDLTLANKMAEVAKREGLDLLHVHYAVPHAVSAIIARQIVGEHLKVVTTLHGTDITVLGYDPSLTEIIRFGIDHSDAVTAVSQHLVDHTKELLETLNPIQPVYNFIDESVYYPRDASHLRGTYGIDPDEKVIVHISNFRKVKRTKDVVEVFDKINEHVPSRLLLIGDGPELSTMCQLVKEKGLRDRVIFLGKQDNVAELLSMSDLKLLLSEKESFGLVLLEAMACGVPVVATNVGGIPEVIDDGNTGFLCEVGDIEAVAERALQVLTDEALHRKLSENGIHQAEERFHSCNIVTQYEAIYNQVKQS